MNQPSQESAKGRVRQNQLTSRITGIFQLSVSMHGRISARIQLYNGTILNTSFSCFITLIPHTEQN